MTFDFKQTTILDNFCTVICNQPKIRFCGVVNSLGRLVAGSFKDNIMPLDNEQQRQMLYMQSRLELSMKSEFNDNLGHVNYVVTYRDNVIIINIPSDNQQYHIMISAERIANPQEIIICVADLLSKIESISCKQNKDSILNQLNNTNI